MAKEYAKERNIKLESARKVLERHLKTLIQQGIVERIDTYPVTYKLKRLPTQFLSSCNKNTVPFTGIAKKRNTKQKRLTRKVLQRYLKALIQGEGLLLVKPSHLIHNKNFRLNDPFDLSKINHNSETLGKSANPKQKLQELRKVGLRVITLANSFRQKALLTTQYKHSIYPGTREYDDIAFLFEENMKYWNRSIMVFEDDNGEFMTSKVRTRFNDSIKAFKQIAKSNKALDNAFKKYKDALMITLTVPHIFPLIVPVREGNRIIAFIPLQDSVITQLKKNMLAWIRKNWKGKEIKTFTAYEYHGDYVLHIHILVFGIPYLINWSRKYGSKKEDALTYYSREYNIPLTPSLKEKLKTGELRAKDKTRISKYIFTALLDKWLKSVLTRFGSILKMNLLDTYLRYKEREGLQGPINEIHRIRNGKWKGKPPKDSIVEYSSGAAYRKVLSPKQYVLKYVTKMAYAVAQGLPIEKEEQGKVYGYWLFGKRFNSYSPSLLPKKDKVVRVPYWHFLGVFDILDLPDYIYNNITLVLA